ncbi:hypothetical protein HYH03_003967 [Edaphochlamys debaryana]|uniref:Uncharacterized protein n=1 Tax=Edaphochlamys debaryana TaxID=47281 RepID=A0A835YCC1_9CHLO|nr:hypothetical protein HYH03_003967 [Edaphochlamys debaryana]|eukprot:KAG2498216.1 hypothetical protein HYH03_003967 [Edaphochlamys debaryana]
MTGERDDQPEGERQEEGSVEAAGLSVDGTVGRAAEGPTEARVSRSGTGCGMGDGDGGGGGGGGSFASGTSGAAAAAEACGALALPLGPGLPLGGLVAAAKEMLRRPGMQQEVLRFLEEDPGARRLLLQLGGGTPLILPAPVPAGARGREGAGTPVSAPGPEETDTELEPAAPHSCTAGTSGPGAAGAAASPAAGSGPTQRSAGIHSSKGSDEGSDGNDRDDAGAGGRDGAGGPNLASRVAGAVVGGLEHAGGKLAGLGGWLRSRLGHAPPAPQPQPHPQPGEREPARQEQGRQASASGGSGGPGGAQAKAPWAPPPPVGGGCGRDAGSGFGSERTPLQHGAEPLVAVVALVVAIFCVAFLRRPF